MLHFVRQLLSHFTAIDRSYFGSSYHRCSRCLEILQTREETKVSYWAGNREEEEGGVTRFQTDDFYSVRFCVQLCYISIWVKDLFYSTHQSNFVLTFSFTLRSSTVGDAASRGSELGATLVGVSVESFLADAPSYFHLTTADSIVLFIARVVALVKMREQ